MRLVTPSSTLEQRYWSHVQSGTADECWPWTAHCNKLGYGKVWVGYDAQGRVVMESAHRVAWMLKHGDWPGDLHVRHTCDNPPCQNPAHLIVGNHQDNMRDMADRGRAAHIIGERHGLAKLTEEAVRDIVTMRDQGHTLKSIANSYGVHFETVRSILVGQTWSETTGLPRIHRLAPVPRRNADRRGEKNNSAKLTEADIRAIRAMKARGKRQHEVAAAFGVGQTAVSRILSGKSWGHIT